ncbi:SPOR domain-containing protein [Mangrovibacterium sp.]|uniref:SPOR domain-containing protein n=1 Tax=Mangrovibacterium sp. TaxID=1961364 RepID=UPI003567EE3E
MRRIIFGAFMISLLFTGCKSMQRMKNNEAALPAKQEQAETKVFSVAEPQAPKEQAPAATQTPIKPVRTQTETFTFDQKDDATKYQGSSFFVIIGSFSSVENANKYKQELIPQGFNPIVLHSETGYYRVCVNSYAEEASARQRVNQIRSDFPKYADTWLLIKR